MTTTTPPPPPQTGILCLPMNVIDTLFSSSKTRQPPPSHLLVRISLSCCCEDDDNSSSTNNNSHAADSSSCRSSCCTTWWNSPCAFACQLVSRDFRQSSAESNLLSTAFVDTSIVLLSQNSEDDDIYRRKAAASSSSSVFCPAKLAVGGGGGGGRCGGGGGQSQSLPVSHVLVPNLLQSFVDLPVAVDALLLLMQPDADPGSDVDDKCSDEKGEGEGENVPGGVAGGVCCSRHSRTLALEQCVVVKGSADATPNHFHQQHQTCFSSVGGKRRLLFRRLRLRFAVPLIVIQQQQKVNRLSSITLSCYPPRRQLQQQQHRRLDDGKSVLAEGLINTLCVCGGGQSCHIVVDKVGITEAANANNIQAGTMLFGASPTLYNIQAMEGAGSGSGSSSGSSVVGKSVDIVGPETKVIINTRPPAAAALSSSLPGSFQKNARHVDATAPQTASSSKRYEQEDDEEFPYYDGGQFSVRNGALEKLLFPSRSSTTTSSASSSPSVFRPSGVLVCGPAGNGKTRFVNQLLNNGGAEEASSLARYHHCRRLTKRQQTDALQVVAEMKKLAAVSLSSVSSSSSSSFQYPPLLILDSAEDFFRKDDDDDESGEAGGGGGSSSPADRFLSMWTADKERFDGRRRTHENDKNEAIIVPRRFWTDIVLVCTISDSMEHLISDSFRRHFFAVTTVKLELPNEAERKNILSFFLKSSAALGREFPVNIFSSSSSSPFSPTSSSVGVVKQLAENQQRLAASLQSAAEAMIGHNMWDLASVANSILASSAAAKRGAQQHQKQKQKQQPSIDSLETLIQNIQREVTTAAAAGSGTGSSSTKKSSSSKNKQQQQQLIVKLDPAHRVTWNDVAGLAKVKEEIHRAILWPIENPRQAKRFGIDRLSGVMLHGPPGCAKTSLAKAICTEGKFGAFFHMDCASVLSAFVGEAERCIRNVFAQARAQAPSVIFFDEIESFGSKRGGGGGGSSDIGVRLLATLLTEMDGIVDESKSSSSSSLFHHQQKNNDADDGNNNDKTGNGDDDAGASSFGVCVIGATNLLHLVDEALLRPGRFDLLLHVPLPDGNDREKIIRYCLEKSNRKAKESSSSTAVTADVMFLAAISQGLSGAAITGAWRDGVVACVLKKASRGGGEKQQQQQQQQQQGRNSNVDDDIVAAVERPAAGHDANEPIAVNVTEEVATALRGGKV